MMTRWDSSRVRCETLSIGSPCREYGYGSGGPVQSYPPLSQCFKFPHYHDVDTADWPRYAYVGSVIFRVGGVQSQDEPASGAAVVRARSGATLVIAAVSLLPQWETELKRHAPSLSVLAYHGATRQRVKLEQLLSTDVVLTSYQMLRTIVNVTDGVEWHRIVFDGKSRATWLTDAWMCCHWKKAGGSSALSCRLRDGV